MQLPYRSGNCASINRHTPLTLFWTIYYDVRVSYVIFTEFLRINPMQYKYTFPKCKNIRTVLLPTVHAIPSRHFLNMARLIPVGNQGTQSQTKVNASPFKGVFTFHFVSTV